MYSRTNTNQKNKIIILKYKTRINYCKVSQASTEIMLDRFYNGEKIEFPFIT